MSSPGLTSHVGDITINGGVVTATCGSSGSTVIGRGTNGACGDICIAMDTAIPTVTLNNPQNSGTPIYLTSFLDPGSGQSVNTPDIFGLENFAFDNTDAWYGSYLGYRFGCPTIQQFRFELEN